MKKLETFLDEHNLEHSLIIGYYGGGNYGDELLLEVLATSFSRHGLQDIAITYQQPHRFRTFHHDYGYQLVSMADKFAFLHAIREKQNIIVGGGGLWGLDVNFNIFILGWLLWIARYVFKKNVYLLGVGYYDSASRLGRISAWLAGKAAVQIVARDKPSQHNFEKITSHVTLDTDLAWHLTKLPLVSYKDDFLQLDKSLPVNDKTLFITLRRFRPHQKNNYTNLVESFILNNPDRHIIVSLMEPKTVDPAGYHLIRTWQKRYAHVQATDFGYNPVALYLFFRKHAKRLALIAPQFHTILTAHLAGVPVLPISYDHKVAALLKELKYKPIPIAEVTIPHLQQFASAYYNTKET